MPTDDLRLPFASDFVKAGDEDPAAPTYIGGFYGQRPKRISWGPPSGNISRSGNKMILPGRILARDFKTVMPYLRGWAVRGGPGGTLRRTPPDGALPIADPLGMGYVCTDILAWQFQNYSGYRVLEIPPDNIAPDGNAYDGTADPSFTSDVIYGQASKLGSLYRYCVFQAQFEHVRYGLASDDVVQGSPRGERERFMITTFVQGVEYVTLKDGSLQWRTDPAVVGAPVGPGGGPLNPQQPPADKTPVSGGAGFLRSTGDLKIQWFDLPRDAVGLLLQKWRKAQGGCNAADFDVYLADDIVTYPAQTLLFQPARTEERTNTLGFLTYDATLTMTLREETWVRFLNVQDGNYYPVTWGRNDKTVFPTTDFEALFLV